MKKTIIAVIILFTVFLQNIFGQTSNQSFNSIITAYITLKNTLIKDNGDSVRTKAKALYSTIENVKTEKLAAD
jgi:hypothetical protein